jgi:site-specific DNA recombinase
MKKRKQPEAETKKQVRCAVYTRKSVTEGLEQEFNSLHAQREAGEAFIQSQRHEGWVCLPDRYDDGGFTGANLERPALRKLLADVEAGLVDVVVVYKVDRLSRSLTDFARIMEILEKSNAAFISVTQAFNSSTSMGRLTLNILLSFAQFERETIAERTRDKMGAARRKGKWVGGVPFLGYDIATGGRALAVNEAEALRVREIFELYLRLQSIQAVVAELNHRGWTMKQWVTLKGKTCGGGRFTKSSLHGLLTNMAYIGKVNYKGHIADAEFPGIVPDEVFQAAQDLLKENSKCSGSRVRNKHNALLGGILRCGHCDAPMTHAYTRRGAGKVYRYYVCNRASKEGWDKCPAPSLPAAEVEKFVVGEIARIGEDADLRAEVIAAHEADRKAQMAEAAADKRKLERQLQQIGTAIREAIAKGEPAQLVELQRQQAEASAALAELAARIATLAEQALSEAELHHAVAGFFPAWESLTGQERQRLLRLLVQLVTYTGESDEIAVTFLPTGIKSLEAEAVA